MKTDKGILFVFSGPSGSGKGTILGKFNEIYPNNKMMYSVSATTREPRKGEVDGVNYHFKSVEEFQNMIDNDDFLEWAKFCDNHYGTPKKPIYDSIDKCVDVILEIDTVGALNVKEKYPEAVMIFVLPPSLTVLEERLRDRGTETEETLNKRFNKAVEEIKKAGKYDYIIVNDNLDEAVTEFNSIITSERLKTKINKNTISEVLKK